MKIYIRKVNAHSLPRASFQMIIRHVGMVLGLNNVHMRKG